MDSERPSLETENSTAEITMAERIARTAALHTELAVLWGVEPQHVGVGIHLVPVSLYDATPDTTRVFNEKDTGVFCAKTAYRFKTSHVGVVDLFCAHPNSKAEHAAALSAATQSAGEAQP
jgi:hypothetical protein